MATSIEQDRQTVSTLLADNNSLKRQLLDFSTQLVSLQANSNRNRQGTFDRTPLAPRRIRRFKNDHH